MRRPVIQDYKLWCGKRISQQETITSAYDDDIQRLNAASGLDQLRACGYDAAFLSHDQVTGNLTDSM
jgi:hypothetical protein